MTQKFGPVPVFKYYPMGHDIQSDASGPSQVIQAVLQETHE